jgi:hypothetical protein
LDIFIRAQRSIAMSAQLIITLLTEYQVLQHNYHSTVIIPAAYTSYLLLFICLFLGRRSNFSWYIGHVLDKHLVGVINQRVSSLLAVFQTVATCLDCL